MKHSHLFQHIGGGCFVTKKSEDLPCNDVYECKCGASFKTTSDVKTHFCMPQKIAGKVES